MKAIGINEAKKAASVIHLWVNAEIDTCRYRKNGQCLKCRYEKNGGCKTLFLEYYLHEWIKKNKK